MAPHKGFLPVLTDIESFPAKPQLGQGPHIFPGNSPEFWSPCRTGFPPNRLYMTGLLQCGPELQGTTAGLLPLNK